MRILVSILTLAFVAGVVPDAHAESVRDARKTASKVFKKKSFIAKLDLQTTGEYQVDPDGRPTDELTQGRLKKRLGIGQRDVAFPVGAGGKGIYISASKRKKRIKVTLQKRRGPTMHAVTMFINFNRKLEPADLDPRAIARALASYVTFEGLEVGSELDSALESLGDNDDSSSTSTVSASSFEPALSALNVRSDPAKVQSGTEMALILEYMVSAKINGQVSINESRTLSLNGNPLPGFPAVNQTQRGTGQHVSRFRQPIPAAASPGVYSYKGEVCAETYCISSITEFEVIP